MAHTDDAYAAMLLTMALSPNKEEYARPFSVAEFRSFESAAKTAGYRGIGALLDMDISGLMIYLGLSEAESYRAYTLLHRNVQLSYAMDGYALEGIEMVTQYDAEYPERLRRKLGQSAPPCFYLCGESGLLNGPSIAIVGIGGVRTGDDARASVAALVTAASRLGYGVVTGGEPGVSRLAASLVSERGGTLVEILGGGMRERLKDDHLARMVAEGRTALLSLEHPDALLTANHAVARNRALFALSDAAFIFSTDGRRGEIEALQSHSCDWVYAWEGYQGNRALIARGAKPFASLCEADIEAQCRHWSSSAGEQMSIFDMI